MSVAVSNEVYFHPQLFEPMYITVALCLTYVLPVKAPIPDILIEFDVYSVVTQVDLFIFIILIII